MISAMPALSSAPSNVVPSLVTRSWPIRSARAGSCTGCGPRPGTAPLTRIALKPNRIATPALVDDRHDARTDDVRSRVHVCDEPDRGDGDGPGQGREDRRILGQLGVGETDLDQLVDQHSRQIELLLGARPLRHAIS